LPRPGRLTLETQRLRLRALDLDALQAWVDADAGRLQAATEVVFAEPVGTPPLFGEDLPMFRDRMSETPDELGWWVWLISDLETRKALGVCGLGGRPGPDGVVVVGYAVYRGLEGRGYATEAARAVVAWALGHRTVSRVRATVPTGNLASVAVARKLGMARVGTDVLPEVGEVAVYELGR
jgi:RimJ/RimL family protein N-acetyltransferase